MWVIFLTSLSVCQKDYVCTVYNHCVVFLYIKGYRDLHIKGGKIRLLVAIDRGFARFSLCFINKFRVISTDEVTKNLKRVY